MAELAIVIPAFKEEYLSKALESLALQTNTQFVVYIGDDCSPHDLKIISKKFEDKVDIKYTRFNENIGSQNIVFQWKRCVELSKCEKWIWLFSDDDLVDLDAVENFYSVVNKNQDRFDVYRFNTSVIDKDGVITSVSLVGPDEESSEEMAYNLLLGRRGNSMPDHIFSREVYAKNNGFVVTDYAQAADWATSILFSKEKGICIIPKSILYWRMSGANISSIAKEKSRKMVIGHLQFIDWLLNHFSYLKETPQVISYDMIRQAAVINLMSVIINHYKRLDNGSIAKVMRILINELEVAPRAALRFVYDVKRATPSRLNWMVNFIKGL